MPVSNNYKGLFKSFYSFIADSSSLFLSLVIGCDGLKSKVRKLMLDPDDPAATVKYANESAYRCLLDMDKAYEVLGELSQTFRFWCGHGAHVTTYPVNEYKYLNVAAFVRDYEWPDESHQALPGSLKEMAASFADFGPTIQALVSVLPEEQNRWGMFDSLDHPLSSFAYGSVALAGDAAHASTPHHGYGASSGVEDALVLASVLEHVQNRLADGGSSSASRQNMIKAAFKAYDSVRRERSQWVVASSRRQGQLMNLEIPGIGKDRAKLEKDAEERLVKLLVHDWKKMVAQSICALDAALPTHVD